MNISKNQSKLKKLSLDFSNTKSVGDNGMHNLISTQNFENFSTLKSLNINFSSCGLSSPSLINISQILHFCTNL